MIPPPRHQEKGPLRKVWMEFNRLRDVVMASRPVAGQNIRIDRTAVGSIIRGESGGETVTEGATIYRMVVRQVREEYLVCRLFSDTSTATAVNVAKPTYLRVSSWDDQTIIGGLSTKKYSFTADNSRRAYVFDDLTQLYVDEELQPKYETEGSQVTDTPPALSVIYAIKMVSGTGVSSVDYLDINIDARNYVPNVTEFHLCIGQQLYRAPFHSGPALATS